MDIVFCLDRKVLPGLHVAAYSLLDRLRDGLEARFHLFSDTLLDADVERLRTTLERVGHPFTLARRQIDGGVFERFPRLSGSWAAYYRLLVPLALDVERYLYVDVDVLVDVDVGPLETFPFGHAPTAWVPEAPLEGAVDVTVAEQLRGTPARFYYNSGVMLVNVDEWRAKRISERCMEYLAETPVGYHDQSALNWVLRGSVPHLEEKYNFITNKRANWAALRQPYGRIGRLVHFVDSPKPWDLLGEVVHPQYALWRSVLDKTALSGHRSWQASPSRKVLLNAAALRGYKKALKDRLLFGAYRRGWLRRVKGMPPSSGQAEDRP